MVLKARLNLDQRQRLALTPAMHQSLRLLRMPTLELAENIAREADENPFLIVEEEARAGANVYDAALATTAAKEGLTVRLARQIAMQNLDPVAEAAALYLVTELREDGYLDVTLAEISAAADLPLPTLEAGLSALQKCDPAGIGARTLAEYLELRLKDSGVTKTLAGEAVRHLTDFAEERWRRLRGLLGCDLAELHKIAALLRGYGSAPIVPEEDWAASLMPELRLEPASDGRVNVSLIRSALPSVSVMPCRRDDLADAVLRSHYDRAVAIRSGISARSETLLRIGHHIAQRQSAYFSRDHRTMVAETQAEAAAALGLHPSTLGRAVAGKALLADGRVYALSSFFSRALAGGDGAISPFDVQQKIRSLIAAEPQTDPYSDEGIRTQLKQEGVDIARRTVAKYRKCMRIPSSFARRRRKV
ncbi:MAG: hypothetical protein KDE08_07780 [Rhodobacteraceae bacterium]|nr:hypothetical protein [Paracoccaceae bacterium]